MSDANARNMLVLNSTRTMTTLKGHSILFEAGKPTYVPSAVFNEAIAFGAVPPGSEPPNLGEIPLQPNKHPTDATDRAILIMAAFDQLFESNVREDFTATGAPNATAVTRVVGFPVQTKEIAAVLKEYNEAKAPK